jgi:hypothetical protein
MASTTVRVDARTRELLREWAKEQHKPIGEIIADLVHKQEKERFWRELEVSLDRLRADPEAWQEYQDEIALWDTTTGDGLETEPPYDNGDEQSDA